MTMTISREAMDALQQTATTWATAREWSGDCVEELRAILDRCTVVEPTAASAEAQTFGTFGHIGVDKSPLTHAVARASTAPALRGVTDEDAHFAPNVDLWDAINAVVVASGGKASSRSVARMNAVVMVEAAVRAIVKDRIESFRARLSMAQGSPNQFEHECPEWDGLRIKPGMPEWDSCGCFVASGTAPESAK